MSNSLLKKSLELFDENKTSKTVQPKGKSTSKNDSTSMNTKRIGHKKEMRKLKRQQQEKLKKLKKSKTIEDDFHKYYDYDNTEDNLYMIAKMAQLESTSTEDVEKVVEYNKRRLSKNKKIETDKPTEQSIFSDRDFDEFEKEYEVDFFDK